MSRPRTSRPTVRVLTGRQQTVTRSGSPKIIGVHNRGFHSAKSNFGSKTKLCDPVRLGRSKQVFWKPCKK